MVKPVATWFIIATLVLVTTSAQFIGGYLATMKTLNVRASVTDGSLLWEIERRSGPKLSISIEFPLLGKSGNYTVNYADFGRFKTLVTTAFPEVEMQDGDLTNLAPYNELFFKTSLTGRALYFFRKALPLRPGIYGYDQGDSFHLTLTITDSVLMTFRCTDAVHEQRFSDLIVSESSNLQILRGGTGGYASFIRHVAESCPGSDLPTEGTPAFFVFSATSDRVYLRVEAYEGARILSLDRVE
ncbi:hypothetical protein FOZ61_003873 [Perkinsus olseni]|uniref:Uncharacterized protein n=1 Tax=Perkinsus olseni TaxID=32597 RepID=A0A7J6M2E7_PEROL|nr:hypothetical protein FOZ61_003873 [Perkinsus olseni]KAF4665732.1 hypothetical protein FOL46_003498 [Perkinsus olseni]